ncbi:hypothetical protein V7014_21605, partial [Bacillus sp. JJ722]
PVPSEEILHTSEQAVSELLNRFIQLRARGFDHSASDYQAACEIIEAGVPLEQALLYLTERFETYTPKHSRDRINGLNYCVGFIIDKHNKSQESQKIAKRRINDNGNNNRASAGKPPQTSITGNQTGRIRRNKA